MRVILHPVILTRAHTKEKSGLKAHNDFIYLFDETDNENWGAGVRTVSVRRRKAFLTSPLVAPGGSAPRPGPRRPRRRCCCCTGSTTPHSRRRHWPPPPPIHRTRRSRGRRHADAGSSNGHSDELFLSEGGKGVTKTTNGTGALCCDCKRRRKTLRPGFAVWWWGPWVGLDK
jgi:hypothetical protein